MNFSISPPRFRTTSWRLHILAVSLWIALLSASTGSVCANVYATQVRVNDTGDTVTMSYVLNEPASAGVSITIKSGATTVRTDTFPGGGTGTTRGSNYFTWNRRDDANNPLPPGQYTLQITAASTGHGSWTQISNDADEGNYAYLATGIAVNRNTNSLYYGRVFVANAVTNPLGVFLPGDGVGLIKANADGSLATEGGFSDGGWAWAGDYFSPWKVEVSADDYIYVNDWASNGVVLRFDQMISPASRTLVLRPDNWPNGGQAVLAGPAITGTGDNTQIWMADINPAPAGVGLRRFSVTAGGILATNDLGVTIVQTGGDSLLTDFPYDVALDSSNRIYTIQKVTDAGSPTYRVFRFPAYTNGSPALTNADWQIGAGDDNLRSAFGIAVNPAATYVAVALEGVGFGPAHTGGGVRVLNAEDGTEVTTITPSPLHAHTDVAWDNVGNLYTCDNADSVWRAYSPPGTNFATTVALATVNIGVSAPTLSAPGYANGEFHFTLNGQGGSTYIILSSTNLQTWTPVTTNASASASRPITVPAPAAISFYRAVLSP